VDAPETKIIAEEVRLYRVWGPGPTYGHYGVE